MSEAIPSWVRQGIKIVCIQSRVEHRVAGYNYPEVGGIYTIRGVTMDTVGPYVGCVAIWLVEVRNPPLWGDGFVCNEPSFPTYAFRPLVSQADDISTHFAHLLDTRAPELV